LIHAATMVTAGVYLIARNGAIFALSEVAQMAVLIIGVMTLLVAGLSAMVQRDLKKVLAYSTISQLGYMFLSLGVGAYTAAMFHFMVHAFFKALLFLAAGAIGYSMHHNQDLYKMGALRQKLPGIFLVFLIGSACLAALPLVTAGFYSKEFILAQVYASPLGGLWPWLIGVTGAFITGLYAFRMVFMVFFGISKGEVSQYPDKKMYIPLFILAALSLVAGFVEIPAVFFHISLFSNFVGSSTLPSLSMQESTSVEWILLISAGIVSLSGIFLAYILYFCLKIHEKNPQESNSYLYRFLLSGFGFDTFYNFILIRPFIGISHFLRRDFVQNFCRLVWQGVVLLHELLSKMQTGYVRFYAFAVVFGALVIALIMVFS
jgi:NADH-quinone oxidoreductase subunit L